MSDSEVRKFFIFDETDLNANRSGKLSAKQKSKLESDEKGADQIFVGAGIFFIIVALVIIYFVAGDSILKLFSGESLSSSETLSLVLGGGLPTLFFGFFAYGAFKMGISKLDNTVLSVQGKINFVKVEKRVPTSTSEVSNYRTVQQYELRVGKIAFENVNEELLSIMEEGDTYAFYYTKQVKKILSCEFISKGK
ncbi:MAG: hypothetical protein IT311_05690 [Anaerolineales bacterium]|nr:hypothetical protein [Anaerolineales bacterium]MCZ2121818.1 hypothetical protein [Anaerolineales bacterium]